MCAFCIPALPGRPHPAVLLTPFRHLRLRAPFGRRIFPSHPVALSSKLRPRKPFRCNTYGLPASVANKRLTAWLSPLDATLTKNRGVGACRLLRHASLAARPETQVLSLQILAHSFARSKNTTLLFSSDSALFAQNTRGWVSLRLSCPAFRWPELANRLGRLLLAPFNFQSKIPTRSGLSPLCRSSTGHGTRATSHGPCFFSPYLLTSLPLGAHRAPLATLVHPWHVNASANTSSPISTGAKRSRAPFASRRIPWFLSLTTSVVCESRFIGTNIAGSKLVRATVK